MIITPTKIPEVKLIASWVFEDKRSCFMDTWNDRAFRVPGINAISVEENLSRSVKKDSRGQSLKQALAEIGD